MRGTLMQMSVIGLAAFLFVSADKAQAQYKGVYRPYGQGGGKVPTGTGMSGGQQGGIGTTIGTMIGGMMGGGQQGGKGGQQGGKGGSGGFHGQRISNLCQR